MKKLYSVLRAGTAILLLPMVAALPSFGWGHTGHTMINRLAGQALSADVPAFLRSPEAIDALGYYGPEPDRWRSTAEPELDAAQAPEHEIDLEYSDWVGTLPQRRYDYIRALAAAQAAHPDVSMTPEHVGLLPYVTNEVYERLQNAMRSYRALLATRQDTKPAEAEIVFLAGWLGHYVGDGSQPLHTTYQYNGWTGANPNGYTTEHHIHALFESDFVNENVKDSDVAPLVAKNPTVLNDEWMDYLTYLHHANTLVEKVYQLEKQGAFTGHGTPAGKAMVDERLAAAASELRDMIYSAWVKSGEPLPERHPAPSPATAK